jgi:1,4-dihydroxy-2-naphthoate octaprenyltransferase
VEDRDIDSENGRDEAYIRALSPSGVIRIAWSMIVISFAMTAILLPVAVIAPLVGFIIFSWMYNAKPFQLSRRPIGSIAVLGICYAYIPLMFGMSLGSPIDAVLFLLLGVSFAVSRISLSMLKDYKDARGDALHHKKTFLLVYGRSVVRSVSVALACIGYVGILVVTGWLLHDYSHVWGVWLSLGVLLSGWLVYCRTQLSPDHTYIHLNQQFHTFLHYEILFYGFIAVWVSISLS